MKLNKIRLGNLLIIGVFLSLYACNKSSKQKTKEKDDTKTEEVKTVPALNLSMMDQSVKPQNDFYHFVNGGWEEKTKIPDDKSVWGSFNELGERNDSVTLDLLTHVISDKNLESGSEKQKIADLYNSVTDTIQRNKLGIEPIKAHLKEIDAIKDKPALIKYLAKAQKERYASLLGYYVYADTNNSAYNTLFLTRADLGLNKDYYQKDDAKDKVEKYQKYVGQMLQHLGKSKSEADAEANKIVAFEKTLAKAELSREKDRDAELNNNPYKLAQLKTLMPSINWSNYFKESGLSNVNGLIVSDVQYYKNLEKILKDTPLETIKSYLKWIDFNGASTKLTMDLRREYFAFYGKTLRGMKKMRPLEKRALSVVNGTLGEAIGKIYVAKVFPAKAKAKANEMIDYLFKSYKKHIKELSWMSDNTKEKALQKLSKITRKIGYPDKWKDYSAMKIVSVKDGGSYYQNMRNAALWSVKDNLSKYGKKVDKRIWGGSIHPQTVNAYYSASNNEIVFPAAILQPPFFNFKADAAINFGGMGAVIGHEISHGFDDQGSKYDANGNQKDWWTKQDREKFEVLGRRLAAQYSSYEPLKGNDIHVNGKAVLGEAIADLGGTSVAFDALKMYLKDKQIDENKKIDGFTQPQRFYISWATVWRTKMRNDALINRIKTDPHAPGMIRATASPVNQDNFYKAFNIKPGDKMYKQPKERIKIW